MKNRSSPNGLSTASAVHGEEIALHLGAESRHTHTSQNIHMYIYTKIGSLYTHLHRNKHMSVYTVSRQETSLFNINLLIQQGAHLASLCLQEKYPCISRKTDKRKLPATQERHRV